jgi:ABC-type transport system substrate-binding protein
LRAAGIEVVHPIPQVSKQASAAEDRRAALTNYGAKIGNWFLNSREGYANLLSSNIPTEANRWVGPNTVAFNNPMYDRLFGQWFSTVPQTERQQLEVQLNRVMMEGLHTFPVYYNPLGSAMRAGITGPGVPPDLNGSDEWNIHTWEMS